MSSRAFYLPTPDSQPIEVQASPMGGMFEAQASPIRGKLAFVLALHGLPFVAGMSMQRTNLAVLPMSCILVIPEKRTVK